MTEGTKKKKNCLQDFRAVKSNTKSRSVSRPRKSSKSSKKTVIKKTLKNEFSEKNEKQQIDDFVFYIKEVSRAYHRFEMMKFFLIDKNILD